MIGRLGRARRVLALGVLLLAACAKEAPAPPPSPASRFAAEPDALARGRSLFVGTCTGYCHGGPRGGGRDAPDLFDCRWLHGSGDREIFQTISRGVPGTQMLGFGSKLQDDDLWRLVAYLRSESRCEEAGRAPNAGLRTSHARPTLETASG